MNTEKAKELVALLAEECTSMGDVLIVNRIDPLYANKIDPPIETNNRLINALMKRKFCRP